jgi:hypothetical protein
MTHKRQDCLERPRKKGAKFTNRNIAPDEVIQDMEAGYDAKRDRWNGYDPAEHKSIYDEYEAVEAERQRLREEEIDKQTTTDMAVVRKVAKAGKAEGKEGDPDFGSSDEEDADEDKYADAADAVGQKMDTKTRITVRNLRIREDTAKYLINLDPSSAYYDPKTRSMRDNPLQNVPPEEVRVVLFSVYKLLHGQRHFLPAIIFCAFPARRRKYRSSNFSHGNLQPVGTMSTSMPTQPMANFFTKHIRRRRKNSEIHRKSACSQNMVVRSTLRGPRRSCYMARRRSTSSTLELDMSFMGRSGRRRGLNIPKTVRPVHIFDLLKHLNGSL